METIAKQKLYTFAGNSNACAASTCLKVRSDIAQKVKSFSELAQRIAELQFMNRDFVLMFRGQTNDHLNKAKRTTLKPTLFRPQPPKHVPDNKLLKNRFVRLAKAEEILVKHYAKAGFKGLNQLKRQRILRWSIIQHYGICETPLLDVTHSLRIAASFAYHGAKDAGYVFVLGVPNVSGAITASAEAGLQIVRLSSVCPPSALRPHFQEGYELGQYPEISTVMDRDNYKHYETDFARRLVAKFRFDPRNFWDKTYFPPIDSAALYPNADDPLFKIANAIKRELQ